MLRFLSVICISIAVFKGNTIKHDKQDFPDDTIDTIIQTLGPSITNEGTEQSITYNIIEKVIGEIEISTVIIEELQKDGVAPLENIMKHYNEMIISVDNLTEMLNDSENVYKFIKAKGIDRMIVPNLGHSYMPVKIQIFLLLKAVFNVTPPTMTDDIPFHVADEVMNVFEEDNLALKAHALDILYVWLPNNPKIQAYIMKYKGLEPFYNQIDKLDSSVVYTLLDLFNKIVNEHLEVRNNKLQKSNTDYINYKMYERIGLIERLSTSKTCDGLLNIFETSWSNNNDYNKIIIPVLELIKNVKPFCLKWFKGRTKARELFNKLSVYVKEPVTMNYLYDMKLNLTDIILVIEEYVDKMKHVVKEEF